MTSVERPSGTYVLDASALLRYLDREPGFERVAGLLKEAAGGNARLLISAINWGEVASVVHKIHGLRVAQSTLSRLRALPLILESVHATAAEAAGLFKNDFNLPYADAFAGSLAQRERATLVSADFDFKRATDVIRIEFLPTKKARTKS